MLDFIVSEGQCWSSPGSGSLTNFVRAGVHERGESGIVRPSFFDVNFALGVETAQVHVWFGHGASDALDRTLEDKCTRAIVETH
jgi:hypothetical protein